MTDRARIQGWGEICTRCKHPWNSHAAPENPFGDPMPCEVGGCDCDNLQTFGRIGAEDE